MGDDQNIQSQNLVNDQAAAAAGAGFGDDGNAPSLPQPSNTGSLETPPPPPAPGGQFGDTPLPQVSRGFGSTINPVVLPADNDSGESTVPVTSPAASTTEDNIDGSTPDPGEAPVVAEPEESTTNNENEETKSEDEPKPSTRTAASNPEGLDDIKQQAIKELEPLLDKLDLTPEKRFEIILQVIRVTDNEELVQEAFAAAKEIEDEAQRAEAMVDIINEVNYLTQGSSDTPSATED